MFDAIARSIPTKRVVIYSDQLAKSITWGDVPSYRELLVKQCHTDALHQLDLCIVIILNSVLIEKLINDGCFDS